MVPQIEAALQAAGIHSTLWQVWDDFTRVMVGSKDLKAAKEALAGLK